MTTLVARVHSTKKGHTTVINGKGTKLSKPNVGKDGRRTWEIHKRGPSDWTCSCLSFRFHKKGGKLGPCKHLIKLWNEVRLGTTDPNETTVINPSAFNRD